MPLTFSYIVQLFHSFHNVLLLSTALRIALILYSEWHDAHSVVKYTDVDYRVFSDAARFILHPDQRNSARGPLKQLVDVTFSLGDPYTRETYRYTPLLALLLIPNEWIHPSFGKYLFAACDIINGALIYNLLVTIILPGVTYRQSRSKHVKSTSISTASDADHSEPSATVIPHTSPQILATFYSSIYLLNPLVFSISTRGSSESLLSLLVLFTLQAALKGWWDTAAVMLGVSTHWKIYPVIYGVGCLGVVGSGSERRENGQSWKGYSGTVLNWRTVRFGVVSAGTFLALGAGCYLVWGYPFLHESYVYHLHRLDHRHNFSPYFYQTYLTYPSLIPPANIILLPLWSRILRSPLTSFAPQVILVLGTGLLFGRRKEDLVFTWFVQTVIFVLFNKVCTSQYFLWYLLLLPLLLPRLSISYRQALAYLVVWIGTQALWLSEAYKLEFLGHRLFHELWVRSLIYVMGNCWVLAGIMSGYGWQGNDV